MERLEARDLLSFSAPFSYQFSRDPAAVAVADFNGDGNQDLVVAGGEVTTFLGQGDGTFRNAGNLQLPFGSEAILAVGDFNGDGIPDLAVGNVVGVGILLGNGDGTFRNAGVISVGSGQADTEAVAVGDFAGNGKQDIVLTTIKDGAFELLGNGDGTFQNPIPLPSFNDILALTAGDIFNDGRVDLVGLNYAGQAQLFRSNGDGTFQDPVPFAPGFPMVVTDLNGDGISDLVLRTSHGISERLGNGDGTFQDPITVNLPANAPGTILGVGDFNNDGQLDVAIADRPFIGQAHTLSVLLNDGHGSFVTAPAYATGSFPDAIAAGDFTGAGLPDLVTVGYDGQAHILLNNGDGTFRSGAALPVGGIGTSVVVGDFTGNQKLDIAVFSRNDQQEAQVQVFLGNGDGTFQAGATVAFGEGTSSEKIVAGDFDGDGRLDLAVLFEDFNRHQSFVATLLGNGDGTFRITAPLAVNAPDDGQGTGLATADFNGDGKLDLVVANQGDGNGHGARVGVLLGNGDGTFQDVRNVAVPGMPFDVAAADLNGDGIPDLVTANAITNTVSVLLGHGDGTFGAPVNYPVGVVPAALVVDVFNGTVPDVVVANSLSNTVSVRRGNGDGTLQNAVPYLVGVDPRSLVAADFNGDGTHDLAVANFHSGDVSVLINRADSAPRPGRTPTAGAGLFISPRPEPADALIGHQPTVVAGGAASTVSRPEMVTAPPAKQALDDAVTVSHQPKGDQVETAHNAGLVDPLAEPLDEALTKWSQRNL
jgi:hypothetical protein